MLTSIADASAMILSKKKGYKKNIVLRICFATVRNSQLIFNRKCNQLLRFKKNIMKFILLPISLLLLIASCSVQGDLLLVKSEFYVIENKSIIFQNSDLTINVSGKNGRPDIYNLSSTFNIGIQTKSDSLVLDLGDINLVADHSKMFNKYFVNGPEGDSKSIYNLAPNHEYIFGIEGILFDSLLIEMNDNLKDVNLIINGISKSDIIINIPVFLFESDSTIFNIIN